VIYKLDKLETAKIDLKNKMEGWNKLGWH
jgi:hypothetical protein